MYPWPLIFQLTMVIEANGMQFGLSHMHDFKIELVRSVSSIWNQTDGSGKKLHDTRVDYHSITFLWYHLIYSPNTSFYYVQTFHCLYLNKGMPRMEKFFFLGMDKLKWHNLNNWFFFIFVKEIKVSKNTFDREKKGPFRSKWNKIRHKYSVVWCHWALYNYKQKWTRFGVTLSVVSFAALVWSRHATRFYPRSVTRSSKGCK